MGIKRSSATFTSYLLGFDGFVAFFPEPFDYLIAPLFVSMTSLIHVTLCAVQTAE
jgi:hypothetical protein